MLDGRRSFFRAGEIDAGLLARCEAMDVHPSGPLWGRGASPATEQALAVESAVLTGEAVLCTLLESQGLEQERRSLRLPVRDLDWALEDDELTLAFELPRGAFATAVLHEIVAGSWADADGAED
jgi:tRNA pseudouridine13 synthase